MRKRVYMVVTLLVLCSVMLSCGKKEKYEKSSANVSELNAKVDNFSGACGYITSNQVYDYSSIFDEVYDWGGNIKMPFEKPENVKIGWYEDSYPLFDCMYFYDITSEEMQAYVEEFEEKGYKLYKIEDSYKLYKDNLNVTFSYNKSKDYYAIFVYTGNVLEARSFSVDDAKKMIEDNNLLENNEVFDEYYIFAIEHQTVSAQGYYEFLIEAVDSSDALWEQRSPYYLLTDGKEVLLFEQNIVNGFMPSNVNILKTDGKEQLVASTIIIDQTYNSYVSGYELLAGKFEKKWNYDWRDYVDILPTEEVVLTKVEDNELKYYVLKAIEDYDHKKGKKDFWIIDREYDMEATLAGPTAY